MLRKGYLTSSELPDSVIISKSSLDPDIKWIIIRRELRLGVGIFHLVPKRITFANIIIILTILLGFIGFVLVIKLKP